MNSIPVERDKQGQSMQQPKNFLASLPNPFLVTAFPVTFPQSPSTLCMRGMLFTLFTSLAIRLVGITTSIMASSYSFKWMSLLGLSLGILPCLLSVVTSGLPWAPPCTLLRAMSLTFIISLMGGLGLLTSCLQSLCMASPMPLCFALLRWCRHH